MSMTNASMDAQTRPQNRTEKRDDSADAQASLGGLDPTVVVQAKPANVVSTATGAADPNWSHCDIPNDFK